MNGIKALFQPEGVAVLGASNSPDKAGFYVMKNLMDMGYDKPIYPVNSREGAIQGLPCYASLSAIEGRVDLLVLIMPATAVYSVMEDLQRRMKSQGDVKVIVCAASDFAETGTQEGRNRQKCLMETAAKYGIRVVGPNCIGVIDAQNRVNTTFVDSGLAPGTVQGERGISFVSQSGSVAAMLLMVTASQPYPVMMRKFTSIGNMADVDFIDILEYYEQDEGTRVIGIYMEGYAQGRRLMDTLARITLKKPVVALKVGRSAVGAEAAGSHTGSMAGADEVYDAAFRQSGVIRVNSLSELLDTLQALDTMPLPRGNGVFVLSQTGGMGIFSTDEVSKNPGLCLTGLSQKGETALQDAMPAMSSIGRVPGYADITVSATVKQHVQALDITLGDPAIDAVVFLTVMPTFIDKPALGQALARFLGEPARLGKPVFCVVLAGDCVRQIRADVEAAGLYTFPTPERAVRTLGHLTWYARYRKRRESHG